MNEVFIALAVFIGLCAASLVTMFLCPMLPARHRDDQTTSTVRLIISIFSVMTSLVFGLMINSAKNTFDDVTFNVHAYGTNLILMDRTLRNYGIEGRDARSRLYSYVKEAIAYHAWTESDDTTADTAGQALNRVGDAIAVLTPADDYHRDVLNDIRSQFHSLVAQRWALVEQSEGSLSLPLVAMVVAWLMLVFSGIAFRAPPNMAVILLFVFSAWLFASSFYLILDMNRPFEGPIQISDAPLKSRRGRRPGGPDRAGCLENFNRRLFRW
jgi:hypothetical protein